MLSDGLQVETPALALLPDIVEACGLGEAYASCYALSDMVTSLAFTFGPLLGGISFDHIGPTLTFAILAVLCAVAAIPVAKLRRLA